MAEQRVQRRLAAILAADVVGYSRGAGRLAFELHGWPLLNRRDNPTTAWLKSETKRREMVGSCLKERGRT